MQNYYKKREGEINLNYTQKNENKLRYSSDSHSSGVLLTGRVCLYRTPMDVFLMWCCNAYERWLIRKPRPLQQLVEKLGDF